jgi:hypothetical protein
MADAPKSPKDDREAKLAQALRANLRRRKTGPQPRVAESSTETKS